MWAVAMQGIRCKLVGWGGKEGACQLPGRLPVCWPRQPKAMQGASGCKQALSLPVPSEWPSLLRCCDDPLPAPPPSPGLQACYRSWQRQHGEAAAGACQQQRAGKAASDASTASTGRLAHHQQRLLSNRAAQPDQPQHALASPSFANVHLVVLRLANRTSDQDSAKGVQHPQTGLESKGASEDRGCSADCAAIFR